MSNGPNLDADGPTLVQNLDSKSWTPSLRLQVEKREAPTVLSRVLIENPCLNLVVLRSTRHDTTVTANKHLGLHYKLCNEVQKRLNLKFSG